MTIILILSATKRQVNYVFALEDKKECIGEQMD